MNGRERRTTIALIAGTVLLCAAAGGGAAAGPQTVAQQQTGTGEATPPAFVVALHDDGSADVTVTYTFDLTDDTRRDAFEELRSDGSAEEAFEDRFGRQIQRIASDAANATGREMSVTAVDVAFETRGETGVVRVTATWDGLAATDGDRLVVDEPFASGFEPDRQFAVVLPDGYAADTVTPSPDRRSDGRVSWSAGTDLDGFELSASSATEAGDEGSADDGPSGSGDTADGGTSGETPGKDGPGFGVVVGFLALLGAALAIRRR